MWTACDRVTLIVILQGPLHFLQSVKASFLRFFFSLLYHQFAWIYDAFALTVSIGQWNRWILTVLPYLDEYPVLELGFGVGHLQESLIDQGMPCFGLDESEQMVSRAKRRLASSECWNRNLVRGDAKALPFSDGTFGCVVATFPSQFIFDPQTLTGVERVLKPAGRLIIIPFARITGTSLILRLAAGLFQITGETPSKSQYPVVQDQKFSEKFTLAGFHVQHEIIQLKESEIFIIIASKEG